MSDKNNDSIDHAVIEDFGKEWQSFDQSQLSDSERKSLFDAYFSIFPWGDISSGWVGFDAGCGSGRWALIVADRVKHLHCVEPSAAIEVAKRNLKSVSNCTFHNCTISDMPLPDASMDFGYCLGVLHHITDTQKGLNDCVRKLKSGAPFLVYIYYAFDNQPYWFRLLWKCSDIIRGCVSIFPYEVKRLLCDIIALAVYYPLARMAFLLDKCGLPMSGFPLSAYRNRSLLTMRTDALDRFGSKLERRFTKPEIENMMQVAGLEKVRFSTTSPFYCAIGFKK